MRYAARRILEPNYEVIEAGSGEEAIERIGERHFNIALVDFRLPGISGSSCSPRSRSSPPRPTS